MFLSSDRDEREIDKYHDENNSSGSSSESSSRDRKSTRLNSSHSEISRMPSSA